MSVRKVMTMRAFVERDSDSTTNGWGQENIRSWATHQTIACFSWSDREDQEFDEDKKAVVEIVQCIFPSSADVTESDRISSIKDRNDVVLRQGPFEILSIETKHNHKQARLRRSHS